MIVRLFFHPVTTFTFIKERGIYAHHRINQAALAAHLNTYFINICSRDKRICYRRDLNRYFLESPYYECKSRHTRFCVCHYVCHCHTARDVGNKPFSKTEMDVVLDRFVHHPECFMRNFNHLRHAPCTSDDDCDCNRSFNFSCYDCCQ